MILKSIELRDFRNYESLELKFDPGINILYGKNAQGKTNLLEAIYVSATTKSHRGSKDRELIRFDREEAHIRAILEKNEVEEQIDIHIKKNQAKGIAINRVPIRKASELFGLMYVVFFSPEDLNIIKNGPGERRRFLDMELCQLDKIYFYELTKYNKILHQRNYLLRNLKNRSDHLETLDVWDLQLVEQGKNIVQARRKFIEELDRIVHELHYEISGKKEGVRLEYEPNCTEEEMEEKIKSSRDRDIRMAQTTHGPHRDDFSFLINGVDARKFGSQGQQRTCALSLKLSEIEIIKRFKRETPILLLDDVLSELDRERQNFLVGSIQNIQTVMTGTGLDEWMKERFNIDRVFHVSGGKIEPCERDLDYHVSLAANSQ